jgi:hypothetical protein
MAVDITFRTAGAWGAGTGADLAAGTIDLNFYNLKTAVETLQTNPPVAVSITSITVVGNLMSIHLSNGDTEGPFALPVVGLQFRGEYTGGATYTANDIFTINGQVWLVKEDHTAPTTFNAFLMGNDGLVYVMILAKPVQPYDFAMFFAQPIPGDGSKLLQTVSVRDVTIPANFDLSQAFLAEAPTTNDLRFDIKLNGALIGTIEFVVGVDMEVGGPGQFGAFHAIESAELIFLQPRDRLTVDAPDVVDPVAANLSVTIAGRTEAV